MNRPTCKTCAYWNASSEARGQCRRYAPPPVAEVWVPNHDAITEGFLTPHWRVTYNNHWCGEHPEFPKYIKSLEATDD